MKISGFWRRSKFFLRAHGTPQLVSNFRLDRFIGLHSVGELISFWVGAELPQAPPPRSFGRTDTVPGPSSARGESWARGSARPSLPLSPRRLLVPEGSAFGTHRHAATEQEAAALTLLAVQGSPPVVLECFKDRQSKNVLQRKKDWLPSLPCLPLPKTYSQQTSFVSNRHTWKLMPKFFSRMPWTN